MQHDCTSAVNNIQVCPISLFNLYENLQKYEAGQVALCYEEWVKYTSDPEILRIVEGDFITFIGTCPQNSIVRNCNVSDETRESMHVEIQSMLNKKIIVKCEHEKGEYLSPIFPVDKNDGSLKKLI